MVTSETATLFCFHTPGADAFYMDASEALGNGPEPTERLDLPRLQESAARNATAIQILGPPPFSNNQPS